MIEKFTEDEELLEYDVLLISPTNKQAGLQRRWVKVTCGNTEHYTKMCFREFESVDIDGIDGVTQRQLFCQDGSTVISFSNMISIKNLMLTQYAFKITGDITCK